MSSAFSVAFWGQGACCCLLYFPEAWLWSHGCLQRKILYWRVVFGGILPFPWMVPRPQRPTLVLGCMFFVKNSLGGAELCLLSSSYILHAKTVFRLMRGDFWTWMNSGKALIPLWQHSKRTMTCICHLLKSRKAWFILWEAIVFILHVYKDEEGCGLGSLWQEICKFVAHGGRDLEQVWGCPNALGTAGGRSQEPRRKPALTQWPGVCWKEGGRKLYMPSKGSISLAPLA